MTPAPIAPTPQPPPSPADRLPRTVLWFGVVSLLTDASGELIYPLLPLFLISSLSAPVWVIGLIEGVAESTAALFKLVSGRIADLLVRRKPLVLFGYGLASFVRPLVAVAHSPWTVLAVRFADRVGKGIRSSPRDAMVADVTHPSQRGAAYGYHRAMDNAGAVLGPLAGYLLLSQAHLDLRHIFAWAALPGALAVIALIFGVREAPRHVTAVSPASPPATGHAAVQHYPDAMQHKGRALALYLACVTLFTLGNSSDAFLLVRAAQVLHPGVSLGPAILADRQLLLIWTLHNAVKALLSRRGGALSDRFGRRRLIGAGWLLYAAVYLGFAMADRAWQVWTLFAVYGVYYAMVEGAERALVAELAGEGRRGTAFGWFHALVGIAALPASLLFGLLYRAFGAVAAFSTSAVLAAAACALLAFVHAPARTPPPPGDRSPPRS